VVINQLPADPLRLENLIDLIRELGRAAS